jgi:signal transduction histidine kinase
MKSLVFAMLLLPLLTAAQSSLPPQIADSLWEIWQDETQADTTRLEAMDEYIWNGYLFTQPDSAFHYAQLEYEFAKSKGLKTQMADALNAQGISFAIRGNYDSAIDYFIKSLKIKEEIGDQEGIANLLNNIGIIYEDQGDYTRAVDNYLRSLKIREEIGDMKGVASSFNNIGNSYYNQDEYLKAIDYHTRSLNLKEKIGDEKGISESLNNLGLVYEKQGDFAKALDSFNRSLKIKEAFGDKQGIANSLNNIGVVYISQGDYKSALAFSLRAFKMAKEVGAVLQTRNAANSLWKVNKKLGNYKTGLEMHELYMQLRDSILSEENEKEVIRQEYQYAYEKQAAADSVANAQTTAIQNAQIAQQQAEIKVKKNQQYGLFIGLVLMFILAAGAYYRFQSKKKANEVLQKTLADLKSAQAQLIQSEKMASLGELTAGIAHEIQNPLNFVNNFSEVSTELLDEVSEELNRVKTRHASSPDNDDDPLSEAEAILSDIKQNLHKITHHGKRADAIVKGMLAHSRAGKGTKEPTDINALADEYLRLSYHGLRAKDKTFNADFKMDLDPGLPLINMEPQDIGRVLLNILNNAFYAASLAHQIESTDENPSASAVQTGHAPSLSRPMIVISTKNLGDKIQISISDNGPGIPDSIKDKIFQPFFTTKPTGQGTGLGLSLSYDIVKAHGGDLKVETTKGEGSKFIIEIPAQ